MVENSHLSDTETFIKWLAKRHPGQPEFHQAVEEVAAWILPFIAENPKYQNARIFERLTEPDRVVSFRVCWEDDAGQVQINRGYRVQFSNALGPYKGGLRFHPSVNESILKFLGFEQIFKNSLTGLFLGGGKGGSDFDPKGRTDREVMRFCQAFINELYRHIGPECDVPAGDIGVGAREIGYMYGHYKKLTNSHKSAITGKGLQYGGSLIRPEATGYGVVYFAEKMLHHRGRSLSGKKCLISGSGNVAQYTAEKILELGGVPITMSDSSGTLHDPKGINREKLDYIMRIKNTNRQSLQVCAEEFSAEFLPNQKPWSIAADAAFPSATQNEILEDDANQLIKNGCRLVVEGANMPSSTKAIDLFLANEVLFAPSKAANAGGVAVSGLEMAQNSQHYPWTRKDVDHKLKSIMEEIHDQCVHYGCSKGEVNYVKGANLAAFVKVADSLLQYGLV